MEGIKMVKRTSRLIGISSSLVGIILTVIFAIYIFFTKSTFEGCCGEEVLFFLTFFCITSAICFTIAGLSSLFAHKNSKLPGVFMLVSALFGIYPISTISISQGFYCSTISVEFVQIALFMLPCIGIIYASTMSLFANNLQDDSKICIHRKVTIFTASTVFSFISLLIFVNPFTDFSEYDLINPSNFILVLVLFIVLILSGIGSVTGSCLWLKKRDRKGFYTLLTSSIVGIGAIITIICLFQNKPFFHVLLLITLLVTLVENILLRMACLIKEKGVYDAK
jgi:hypothetical protein